MGLRDDVRQRRHEKIKTLLEEYAAKQGNGEALPQVTEQTVKEGKSRKNEVMRQSRTDEETHLVFPPAQSGATDREISTGHALDPELAWKRNPNPWSAWEDEPANGGPPRSFVRQTRTYDDSGEPPRGGWSRFRRGLQWKAIAALLVFGGIYGMFHYQADWTQRGQQFVKQALTDEFDFAAAAVWYKQAFAGAPSFIPMFQGDSSGAVGVDGGVSGTV
ncbi:MAG: Peptidase, partial [Paenibacillus sp.]|nr:Peptidase [Paenibacillus sp.]